MFPLIQNYITSKIVTESLSDTGINKFEGLFIFIADVHEEPMP
jgi:hypothetical protein